jgi:predicted component of type VI protein secretion system
MRTLTLAWLAGGELQLQTITADQPCVIGRQADLCQVTLDDRSVSRQHASIQVVNGTFCLRNLSEQNIITLNEEFRLAYDQDRPLKPGDTFRLGMVYLWVMRMDQPEKTVLKAKCANCGKLSDAHLEGFCPWCGRSLANGQLIDVAE